MSGYNVIYQVVNPEHFVKDDLVEFEDARATFTLTNGFLRARLTPATYSLDQACAYVDPVVRAWEFESELRMGFPVIKFVYVGESANPMVPPSPIASQGIESVGGDSQLLVLSRYPKGPRIRVTPEMTIIWDRFYRARVGIGESLQSAVYYGVTVIEACFGSRSNAASALNLSPQILSKLGELSSTRGDSATARKARAVIQLTKQEARWMDYAMRYSLLQLGTLAAGLVPDHIAIADIPHE
jgi:hypothetical protein